MQGLSEVEVPVLVAGAGQVLGMLRVRARPSTGDPTLFRVTGTSASTTQVLESCEYDYEWKPADGVVASVVVHPTEVFSPNEDPRTGRLRTRLFTGTLVVTVQSGGATGHAELEVRSRKLDYETEYRWMLRDITGAFSDAVMMRFAASQHRFEPSPDEPATSVYQRFAFLQAVLEAGPLDEALHHILQRPYVQWETREEVAAPGRGLPPSSRLVRQLARGGPRVPWPNSPIGLGSLPRTLRVERSEPTTDNVPNRFVRYALEHWRHMTAVLLRELAGRADSGPVERGRRDVASLLARLDELLSHGLLREVGRLKKFPVNNQVLHKRPGYRTIFRAFLQSQLAATLRWEGGDDVYGAGKRNVAALYEYWAYITLARALARYTHGPLPLDELVDRTGIRLRGGEEAQVSGRLEHAGVPMTVTLYFNRTFAPEDGEPWRGSWTRAMRPDCSMRFDIDHGDELGPVWLHFDAKYRVDGLAELFGSRSPEDVDAELREERSSGRVKRADLLKMHAYRDAIRRSSGAFVLYPGAESDPIPWFPGEVLPGIGAFRLLPSEGDSPEGLGDLHAFLGDVLDHLVERHTRDRRHRFWRSHVYERDVGSSGAWLPPVTPNQTAALVRVDRVDWMDWAERTKLFNLPIDPDAAGLAGRLSEVLCAGELVLYGSEGARRYSLLGWVTPKMRTELEALACPIVLGDEAMCVRLLDVLELPPDTEAVLVERARAGAAPAVEVVPVGLLRSAAALGASFDGG